MAVNDLTFNQLSTVLNSIVKQATGQQVQQVLDLELDEDNSVNV